VEDQASIKNFDDALNTASRIESVYLRVTALKDIGKMQGQAGHPLAANQTFARALKASRYIDDVDQRAKVLLEINNAQLSALGLYRLKWVTLYKTPARSSPRHRPRPRATHRPVGADPPAFPRPRAFLDRASNP
jgi:hypothetical protein